MCLHCGFGIPADAPTCPGCTRRHVPSTRAFGVLAGHAGPIRTLLSTAGAVALGVAVAVAARLALRIGDPDTAGGTVEVLDRLVGLGVVAGAVAATAAAAALGAWARGIQRVLRAAGVAEKRWTHALARLGWRRSLWLVAPAAAFTVAAAVAVQLGRDQGVPAGDVGLLAVALLGVGVAEAGHDVVTVVTSSLARYHAPSRRPEGARPVA